MAGVEVLGKVGRAGHPAVPVYTVIAVAVRAVLVLFEEVVIVADEPRVPAPAFIQHHVVEAVQTPLRCVVHLAHGLGVIPRPGQLAGQGGRIL